MATTILGTCVSVCLFDAGSAIGGINHFMLPETPRLQVASARFGDFATDKLSEALHELGAAHRRLRAKLFGGMAARMETTGIARDLGARNVAIAKEVLGGLGIPVVAEDVGGIKSRKLLFHTGDGRAWVRYF